MLGEQALLVTALANLVSNAIAYSPRPVPLVSISRRRRGENVEISVTDRGIGIAHKDQERVFERFFRADKALANHRRPGLGLAIVKHVAANHNGTIGLWSQLGERDRRSPCPSRLMASSANRPSNRPSAKSGP